jgi:hypothetical protein
LVGNIFVFGDYDYDITPIYPITIFQNDRLYRGVTMYMYCGKKVYTADTLRINGMLVGRKELLEYKLNSRYSIEKYGNLCECISPGNVTPLTVDIMRSLIHYVTGYFNSCEYSSSNVEKLQLKILNELDGRSGVLVSPYVIRDMCKFYSII